MKILFLSQSGAIGGAERVILDAIATICTIQPRWEVSLIAPVTGALTDRAQELGVATRIVAFTRVLAGLGDTRLVHGDQVSLLDRWRAIGRLVFSSPAIAGYLRRLRRAIDEIHPDAIHANGFKMHLLGARAAPATSMLVWHLHDYIGSRLLMGPLLRMNLPRCNLIVANSQSVAEDARIALGAGAPLQTVLNGVDLERFSPHGPTLDLDACAGLSAARPGVVRVGLIATAALWKGHAVFLRALAALPPELPVRGYVIGGPIYQTTGSQLTMDELARTAAQLGLAGRVGFTGHLNDIPAAMRALDIVVHASTQPEPFGLVVAEAMASGRAVIASAAGGVTELIEDGVDALTHQPGDAGALARAIERLVADLAMRDRLGRQARLTAERRFDRKRMGADLAAIYSDWLNRQVNSPHAAAARS